MLASKGFNVEKLQKTCMSQRSHMT